MLQTVHYSDLSRALLDGVPGEPEVDQLLCHLEESGAHILPDRDLGRDDIPLTNLPSMQGLAGTDNENPLHVYVREVGRVPRMTAEREQQLLQSLEAKQVGEDAAKQELVDSHLYLVLEIVQLYRLPPGLDVLDWIERGNEGLMKASDVFKPGRGYKFSTYATIRVHRSLHDWLLAQKLKAES